VIGTIYEVMAEFTEDGFTFDSAWIDLSVARFEDKRIPRSFRLQELEHEIEMRETDVLYTWHSQPNARDYAYGKAQLKALKRVQERLRGDAQAQR
jgi:hypothetical protein